MARLTTEDAHLKIGADLERQCSTSYSDAEDIREGPKDGFTRLGQLGELALVFAMAVTFMFFFLFSHSKSNLMPAALPKKPGWPQPHDHVRNWVEQHNMYAARAASKGEEPELVFYGDSIFELWRGTLHGEPDPRGHGTPEIFHEHFGAKYRTAVFAIAGDATAHLMWRLQNGEAPPGMQAKAIVVLIGTNDLTYASFQGDDVMPAVNTTVVHVAAIVDHLQTAAPAATILVLGLLPRGDKTLMPDPAVFNQPSKFTEAIDAINGRLHAMIDRHERLRYLDCGLPFLAEHGTKLDIGLMPDALHPSAQGMKGLAECIQGTITEACGGR